MFLPLFVLDEFICQQGEEFLCHLGISSYQRGGNLRFSSF
jgi:hypothetical protein